MRVGQVLRAESENGVSFGTPQKDNYRRRVWAAISALSDRPLSRQRVAILDTADAIETRKVLSLGVRPANLTVVNRSAAHIAGITRTLREDGYPRPDVVVGDLADVLSGRGTYDIVSFDGMGCVSKSLIGYLRRLAACVRDGGVFTATVLAGREANPHARAMLRAIGGAANGSHPLRAWCILNAIATGEDGKCLWHPKRLTGRVYVSHTNQPMLWVATRMERHRWVSPTYHLLHWPKHSWPLGDFRNRRVRFHPPCVSFSCNADYDRMRQWFQRVSA